MGKDHVLREQPPKVPTQYAMLGGRKCRSGLLSPFFRGGPRVAGGGRGEGAWKSKLWPLYQMLCPVPATSSLPGFVSPAQDKLQLASGPAAGPALTILLMLSQAAGPRALAGKSGLPKEAWVTGVGSGGHCHSLSTACPD